MAAITLRERLTQGALSSDEAVGVLRGLLAAIEKQHQNGQAHGRLSPDTILVDWPAQPGQGQAPLVTLGDAGEPSPAYRAPEQAEGASPDPRADIYACGVILFEMLTGQRPAGAEVPGELAQGVPAWLDEAFRASYARPERRFASAGDMLRFLADSERSAAEGFYVTDDTQPDDERARREAELDLLKIRQLAALKRSAVRSHSYMLVLVAGCVVGALQLIWMAGRFVVQQGGIDPRHGTYVLFAMLLLVCAWLFHKRGRRLGEESRRSLLQEPDKPPDLDALSDGSQHWKNLDRMK
jgi:cbb3-type cytochrome oxidase subunit 3